MRLVFWFALVLCAAPLAAGQVPGDRRAAEYLAGAVDALVFANIVAQEKSGRQFYCLPENNAPEIDVAMLRKIVEERGLDDSDSPQLILVIALRRLMELYPCR